MCGWSLSLVWHERLGVCADPKPAIEPGQTWIRAAGGIPSRTPFFDRNWLILPSPWSPYSGAKMFQRRTRSIPILVLLSFAVGSLPAISPAAEPVLTFEADVRPILKAHCFQCHGEAGEKEGGLDLRLRRLMVAGGDSGPAIEPSKPDASLLLRRVARPVRCRPATSGFRQRTSQPSPRGSPPVQTRLRPEPESLGDDPLSPKRNATGGRFNR